MWVCQNRGSESWASRGCMAREYRRSWTAAPARWARLSKCGTSGKCIKKMVRLAVRGAVVLAMVVAIGAVSTNFLHGDSALPLYLGRTSSSRNSSEKLQVCNLHMWERVSALEAGSNPHFRTLFKVDWCGICRGGGEDGACNMGAVLDILAQLFDATMEVAPTLVELGWEFQIDAIEANFASLQGTKFKYASMLVMLAVLHLQRCLISTACTHGLIQIQWPSRAIRLVSTIGLPLLRMIQTRCYTSHLLQAVVHVAYSIFMPLELLRPRRVRVFPMSILRFSGEDILVLSLVMAIFDLQLNHLPRSSPTRLLVEPLALRLVTTQKALEECDCRFFESEFSPPPSRLRLNSSVEAGSIIRSLSSMCASRH